MTEAAVVGLLVATVQFATLVYLAGLGELIAERSGVLNLGVEGMMAMGAVSGFMTAQASGRPWVGFAVAALVGTAVAGVHAVVSVVLGAGQVVSGLAITIGGLGFAAFIGQDAVRQRADATFTDLDIAGLAEIPWAGPILFSQPPVVYLAGLAGVAVWFVLNRTRLGLALRAVGESAAVTDSAGHSVMMLRVGAVLMGGAFAGAAGAFLSLYMAAGWTEGLIAGRGWIAVALVIFGAWRPGRLALGSLLFGFTLALQPRVQTFDFAVFGFEASSVSPALLGILPFALTVAVLIAISIRARGKPSPAPAALTLPYRREER